MSEQHLLDCGYGKEGAEGCNGAWIESYVNHWAKNKLGLAHENQYPYNPKNTYTCPNLPGFGFGAQITDTFFSYEADEALLKKLVYKHGAVIVTVMVIISTINYNLKIYTI